MSVHPRADARWCTFQIYSLHFNVNIFIELMFLLSNKQKIKTLHKFHIITLEVTLQKKILNCFRRCQSDGIEISVQNYMDWEGL